MSISYARSDGRADGRAYMVSASTKLAAPEVSRASTWRTRTAVSRQSLISLYLWFVVVVFVELWGDGGGYWVGIGLWWGACVCLWRFRTCACLPAASGTGPSRPASWTSRGTAALSRLSWCHHHHHFHRCCCCCRLHRRRGRRGPAGSGAGRGASVFTWWRWGCVVLGAGDRIGRAASGAERKPLAQIHTPKVTFSRQSRFRRRIRAPLT